MTMMKCCPKCGKIGHTTDFDKMCTYCNHPTITTKYTYEEYLDDIDEDGDMEERIIEEYVKPSPDFDEELFNKQIEDTDASTHGVGSSSYNKPKWPHLWLYQRQQNLRS